MPVGLFGEERLHVEAQVNGPEAGGSEAETQAAACPRGTQRRPGADRLSSREIGGGTPPVRWRLMRV